jgi:hypothetical protein
MMLRVPQVFRSNLEAMEFQVFVSIRAVVMLLVESCVLPLLYRQCSWISVGCLPLPISTHQSRLILAGYRLGVIQLDPFAMSGASETKVEPCDVGPRPQVQPAFMVKNTPERCAATLENVRTSRISESRQATIATHIHGSYLSLSHCIHGHFSSQSVWTVYQ